MSKSKRKRRIPTLAQWNIIRGILANGWGDGDYADGLGNRVECRQALHAFEDWLESRFNVEFKYRLD